MIQHINIENFWSIVQVLHKENKRVLLLEYSNIKPFLHTNDLTLKHQLLKVSVQVTIHAIVRFQTKGFTSFNGWRKESSVDKRKVKSWLMIWTARSLSSCRHRVMILFPVWAGIKRQYRADISANEKPSCNFQPIRNQ